MYTLHKLLKGGVGGGVGEELWIFLTQKENEDIVNILASTTTGTFFFFWSGGERVGVGVGGVLFDSRRVRKRQTSKCLCVFTGECSTRHQLRQTAGQ